MSISTKSSHSKKHRSEKDKSSKHKSKDSKGKSKATPASTSASVQDDSPFLKVMSKIRMSIPPAFASDLRRGAEEMLDSLIMR
jgi:DNA-directed RNA polymerase I subunit RPA43